MANNFKREGQDLKDERRTEERKRTEQAKVLESHFCRFPKNSPL